MDPLHDPLHSRRIEALRAMTGAQRMAEAFALTEMVRKLFVAGLRKQFPDMPEPEFNELMLKRLEKCRNRNY
ncbi:MAG: hypothetical protein K1X53_01295 [Candidatus Sumerlaeaceae bacterium]|nr:hypothetical protein [Candidatus Sumerlaeaceae bacterium]